VADALGAQFALPGDADTDADLVIHASGQGAGLATALRLAAMEATVLDLSWYGDQPVTLALGEAFHTRRLVLKSSQVGQVANAQRARWDYRRRLTLALGLLTDARLDVLVNAHTPFAQLPAMLAQLATTGPDATLCCRVDYS
jgi:threonine dehydrogenase-like Zn-dependent dehydrogenase